MTTRIDVGTTGEETRDQMMDRKEQIKALAKAWEALGGHVFTDVDVDGTGAEYWAFFKNEQDCLDEKPAIACIATDDDDTAQATPCLAILRDVYGEDCEACLTWHGQGGIPRTWMTFKKCERLSTSTVSRIDAVRLALEDRYKLDGGRYTRPVEFTETNLYGCGEGDDVYTVAEFLDCVKNKLFIDYDGHGNPVRDNLADTSIVIKPSTAHLTIPADATHIIWYNR